MNKKFEMICQMSQLRLKKYVETELKNTHTDITVADGFVFAKGTIPVLLVAHMDTVHKLLPSLFVYDFEKDSVSCSEGIGGDDRCGIYMILEIVKNYNCSVLFCEDEEIGGIGARKFTKTDLAKELVSQFNYAIELDRRGSNDAVFYDCDNEDFEEFITKDFYKTAFGSYSDISTVAPFLKCAAVNLSCGYYNAHTEKEYVVLNEMERSMEEVCRILERTTEKDKFEYIEGTSYYGSYGSYYSNYNSSKNYRSYNWYDSYEEETYENYYIIEFTNKVGKTDWFDTYAVSEAEAVGKFLIWNPGVCFNDVIDIMVDKSTY